MPDLILSESIGYAAVFGLSVLAFGAVPALADFLVRRQRKRFGAWFDAGAEAYAEEASGDPWRAELAGAWEKEVVRLAADGSLDAGQLERAAGLLGTRLEGCEPRRRAAFLEALEADPIYRVLLPIAAPAGAVAVFATTRLLGATFPAAAVLLIAALGLCAAITDMRDRVIPDALVAALCAAGVLLRAACGQLGELAALAAAAALAVAAACGINALHARRHPGERAIGGGDVKALAALVACSGSHGLLWACAAMAAAAAAHAGCRRIAHGRWDKLPLGPSLAAALTIGAIASAL